MRQIGVFLILLFYANVQLQAADNVVVVLDASGSMSDGMVTKDNQRTTRMDAAKRVLKSTLLNLPKDSNVGILVFPRQNWVYELGVIEPKRLNKAIDEIYSSGGTPLGQYMKYGADALLQQRKSDPYGSYKLLIVTDGEANDSYEVENNMNLILARGIVVNTIGVDMAQDHQLATKSNSYANAADPQALLHEVETALKAEISEDDVASEEMFETISFLPSDSVDVILTSITKIQNQPIGEMPPVEESSVEESYDSSTIPAEESGYMLGVIAFFVLFVLFIGICLVLK